jgi:hypothetical protein
LLVLLIDLLRLGILSLITSGIQHHKLIAGELPGAYLVTKLVIEDDLLSIANQITCQKLANKGSAIKLFNARGRLNLPRGFYAFA